LWADDIPGHQGLILRAGRVLSDDPDSSLVANAGENLGRGLRHGLTADAEHACCGESARDDTHIGHISPHNWLAVANQAPLTASFQF
jgi:hypothetical protein